MISILIGEDDFSIHEALEEMQNSSAEEGNLTRLEGERLSLDELRNVVMTLPFFSTSRLVIISGLLSRFEEHKETVTGKKGLKDNPAQRWAEVILAAPSSTTLVLLEPIARKEIGRKNPLYQVIAPHAEVKEFPRLKRKLLKDWIVKRVNKLGGTISTQAVDSLAWMVGGDLWAMSGELEKLVLFCAGRRIEEKDVRQAVGYSKEASIFELIDSIIEDRSAQAYQALGDLLLGGASPAYIIQMLAKQIRNLIITRSLQSSGYSDDEVRERLGLAPNYAWRKTLEQSRYHTASYLKDIYQKLHDADLQIKGGEYPPQMALEILVGELCPPAQSIDYYRKER